MFGDILKIFRAKQKKNVANKMKIGGIITFDFTKTSGVGAEKRKNGGKHFCFAANFLEC